MILKKPYGLLIKYFKLIHFILLLLTIYIASQTKIILNFFQDYVANNYYVNILDNMSSHYISLFLYLALLLTLVMLIALYILLKYKKKPTTFYLVFIGYYTFILLMVLVSSSLMNSLQKGFWESAVALQYRDLARLIYWPELVFVFLMGVRTLGFDVKKFDFKKDIQELELSEEDSELVEINLGFDLSKILRRIRRIIREFYYYFLENKFIFVIIGIILFVILLFNIKSDYEKVTFNYKQGDTFTYNSFKIKVMDSLITNLDYKGNKISEDKYYLLVKLNITNNGNSNQKISSDVLKLYRGNKFYYPSLDLGNSFLDYSEPYYGESIKINATKTYLIPYVIDKKERNKDFKITIYNGFSLKNNEPKTINIKLNPLIIDDVSLVNEVSLNEELSLSGTYLYNSKINIKNYELTDSYNYKYKTCEECKEYISYIIPSVLSSEKKTLLVLDYDFTLDPDSEYYASAQTIHTFLKHFVQIHYVYDNKDYIAGIEDVTPTVMNDKLVLQVPAKMMDATSIYFNLTIRNKSYVIHLL